MEEILKKEIEALKEEIVELKRNNQALRDYIKELKNG